MDDIKSLVTRFYDTWNAHDRDGWLACCDENITFNAPGGIAGQGLDTGRMFWSLWQDAFPDNRCTINVAVAEGNEAVQESVFTGTHTETFHVPGSPDIPATGKSVQSLYAGAHLPEWQVVKLPASLRPRGAHDSTGAHAGLRRVVPLDETIRLVGGRGSPGAWAGNGVPAACPDGGATAGSHGLSQATCQQPGMAAVVLAGGHQQIA